jgi:tetraacyldisaccharide 4'-kinase
VSGRPSWFEEAPRGLLGRIGWASLSPLSWLYGAAASLHRSWYERGPGHATRLGCRVVSVGNLVVGGSGKTPTAAWIASALRQRGHRVVLASRGYGGSAGAGAGSKVEVVSDGRHVLSRAEIAGEEPMWLAAHAPGVPVLVGRHRDVVGFRAVSAFGAQVLVLDDGFQHHRLARDVDLLTIHGSAGFGTARVLPKGPLRERMATLARADALLVVDGPLREEDEARLIAVAADVPRFAVERRVSDLRPLGGGPSLPVDLEGAEVGMLCGIARPASFRETLVSLGARVVAERSFPDHHRFQPGDLKGLAFEASRWVTTEKDAARLPVGLLEPGTRVEVLALETRLPESAAFLDWLETRLRPRPAGRNSAVPKPAL